MKTIIPYATYALVISIVFLAIYGTAQQAMRQEANDPQLQIAEDAATGLATGHEPAEYVPRDIIDADESLAVFVMIFDENGKPLESSMRLNGTLPVPPQGVFEDARARGEEILTWQPEKGVRIASVMERFGGKNPGYVLAGRNLREAESRIGKIGAIICIGWLGALAIGLAGIVLSRRATK